MANERANLDTPPTVPPDQRDALYRLGVELGQRAMAPAQRQLSIFEKLREAIRLRRAMGGLGLRPR
jgi:hypothetical protein